MGHCPELKDLSSLHCKGKRVLRGLRKAMVDRVLVDKAKIQGITHIKITAYPSCEESMEAATDILTLLLTTIEDVSTVTPEKCYLDAMASRLSRRVAPAPKLR